LFCKTEPCPNDADPGLTDMNGPFFVYILASQRNGTLYVGVINNLARRMSEHKAKLVPGFTKKYDVDLLAISRHSIPFLRPAPENIPSSGGGAPGKSS
jgi:GIY-YIG catalytic domain-containing protein